jgi:hypothetical protein
MNALAPFAANILADVVEEVLTEENKQKYGDRLFDFLEDVVSDSETKIDDVLVLPVIEAARKALDIPDRTDR